MILHLARSAFVSVFAAVFVLAVRSLAPAAAEPAAETQATTAPVSITFLGLRLINDNEGLDPTSDAEKARVAKTEALFLERLGKSGQYTVIPLTPEITQRIAKSQPMGECGGCDVAIGKELKAKRIAWMTVQKISNLILNLNVFIADVETNQMVFLKSVDIRGNTDETWLRSLEFLLKNYLLAAPAKP